MHHLDTDVLVEFLRGNEKVVRFVAALSNDVAISTPVLAELYFGAHRSSRLEERYREIEQLMARATIVPFDSAAAQIYGKIRSELHATGKPIGEMDTLIGAVAVAHKAALVTRNVRHFERIKNLRVVVWS